MTFLFLSRLPSINHTDKEIALSLLLLYLPHHTLNLLLNLLTIHFQLFHKSLTTQFLNTLQEDPLPQPTQSIVVLATCPSANRPVKLLDVDVYEIYLY